MKSFAVACCVASSLLAVASAGYLAAPVAAPIAAAVNTGASSQYRSQDNLGQYSFGYDEAGATGGTFRHEKSDAAGNRVGSYGLRGADGRVRVVNYVADANGYRASVQTNEPGTESRDTAGVLVNKAVAAPLPVAAPVAPLPLAAPVPIAPVAPLAATPLPLAAAPGALYAQPALAAPVSFGYNLVSHHLAPLPAPAPLPLALPAY